MCVGALVAAEPPRIIIPLPERVEAPSGERVDLSVTAVGTPPPTYRWTRNGAPLVCDAATLPVVPEEEGDYGTYAVTAMNPSGVTSSSTVLVRPGAARGAAACVSGAATSEAVTDDVLRWVTVCALLCVQPRRRRFT